MGELGEYYAVDFYTNEPKLPNLSVVDPGVQNVDALSRDGKIYSIKTISSRRGTTGSFWDPDSIRRNEEKFHYLLIVILDDAYVILLFHFNFLCVVFIFNFYFHFYFRFYFPFSICISAAGNLFSAAGHFF